MKLSVCGWIKKATALKMENAEFSYLDKYSNCNFSIKESSPGVKH